MPMTNSASSAKSASGATRKSGSSISTTASLPHAGDGMVFESLEAESLHNLLAVGVIVLRQAVDFLKENVTADEQLTFRSKYIPGSTIGKHLRHARDHFVLLLDAFKFYVQTQAGSDATAALYDVPEVSYDTRTRNTPMESSRNAAIEALQSAIFQLEEVVPRVRMDAPLTLHAITPFPQTLKSTFGRELWFSALHAVHHWSMIRVVAGELNLELEESFGIAPSTLVYHNSAGALGKSKSKI